MFRRFVSITLLVWAFGFIWFASALPQPAGAVRTDAVVVMTGGKGRVTHGVDVLHRRQAQKLFVSGVDRDVKPHEFAIEYKVTPAEMACCVQLGFDATDTRTNGNETARWITVNKIKSIRLVTNDWHMRRAQYELARVLPAGITVLPDAVQTEPSLRILFTEYHKLIARRISDIGGA